jgi:heat shock protein HtpX
MAAALGLIIALISWLSGPQIVLAVSHARDATPYEIQVVHNVSEEIAIAAGLPKPEVYVIDDPAPNAFSTGKNPEHSSIVVTTGLLQKLNRDELQGVVAHEMAHIRNQDVRFMTTLAIVAGLIPLLADFFGQMLWFSGGARSSRKDNDQSAGVIMIVGIALAILAPIFAKLLELAVSRHREYLADATAVQFTRYPEGLARALQKIEKDEDVLRVKNRALEHMFIVNPYTTGSDQTESLFSTHPSLEGRLKNIQQMMGQFPQDPASTKS